MKRCDNITDGYTEAGYVAAVPGLYGALEFEYRPYPYEEREKIRAAIGQAKADAKALLYLKAAVQRICTWGHCDADGKPLAVTLANIRTMRAAKLDRVVDIVLGFGASDINPAWDDDKKGDEAELLLESLGTGTPLNLVREAKDEKNSDAG